MSVRIVKQNYEFVYYHAAESFSVGPVGELYIYKPTLNPGIGSPAVAVLAQGEWRKADKV